MTDVVVVGFIRTREGNAAVAAAIEETRRRRGRLVIVHSTRGADQDAESVIADREALEQLEQTLRAQQTDVTVHNFARGKEPAEDLVDVAIDEDAAVIVIGLRRRSPVGKLLLGSNAQEVLLAANCPVLAVKAER